MKMKMLLVAIMLLVAKVTYAGTIFGTAGEELAQEIKDNFPLIVGIVFLVTALFNLGHFMGETRDYKKGIGNILIYVFGVLLTVGGYAYLSTMSLN